MRGSDLISTGSTSRRAGRRRCWTSCGLEERAILGAHQNLHGLQPGGLRCGVRRSRKGTGIGFTMADNTRARHDLHGRPSSHKADGLGGAGPLPAVGAPREEAHRFTTACQARCHHRDPVCPAHKGVAGNEKADERVKIAAEEPHARGVEWLSSLDRNEARPMPLPRSLTHLKREISETKWVEARQWTGGWTSKTK